jgi:hypothetical protein
MEEWMMEHCSATVGSQIEYARYLAQSVCATDVRSMQ